MQMENSSAAQVTNVACCVDQVGRGGWLEEYGSSPPSCCTDGPSASSRQASADADFDGQHLESFMQIILLMNCGGDKLNMRHGKKWTDFRTLLKEREKEVLTT